MCLFWRINSHQLTLYLLSYDMLISSLSLVITYKDDRVELVGHVGDITIHIWIYRDYQYTTNISIYTLVGIFVVHMRSFCWCVPFQSTRLSLGFSIPCLWATTLFLCIGLTLDFSWKKKKNKKGLLEKKNFGLQWLIFDFYFICTWTVGDEKLLLVPRTSSRVCDLSKIYMHRPTSAGLRLPPQGELPWVFFFCLNTTMNRPLIHHCS